MLIKFTKFKCYNTYPVVSVFAFGGKFEDVVVCDGKVHVAKIHVTKKSSCAQNIVT